MNQETDVLIVGAGPTGLMMAAQLQRFKIPFRIIDKQADRSKESRAFGIQAKTMEIFQNLKIAEAFLKKAQRGTQAEIYIQGKRCLHLNIEKLDITGTPFPYLYFLPQSEIEAILIDHLQKNQISIERQVELVDLTQNNQGVTVKLNHLANQQSFSLNCKFIIGCDGAHSTVRHLLGIGFEGGAYQQEFMLADADVEWSYPGKDSAFRLFVDKAGIFGVIPLPQRLSRIMAARVDATTTTTPPTQNEIENFGKLVLQSDIKISNMIWSSRFHLHHRAVKNYSVARAHVAGDAAHIHTPAGGQGMNTGLQDATNLAWKLALVLKYGAPEDLLATYQSERHLIGQVLVNKTDKAFGMIASQNYFIKLFRFTVLPWIFKFINKRDKIKQAIFLFMSELKIHYHASEYAYEVSANADNKFKQTLGVCYRAPDAPFKGATLFEKFSACPFTILLFVKDAHLQVLEEQQLEEIEKLNHEIMQILTIEKNAETEIIFDRYGVTTSAIYFIRPDGYIGFRAYGMQINALFAYVRKLLTT